MTTQAEVAQAFARNEDAPNVASNFRRIESTEGTKEYLCGGRNGEAVVLAVREPMGRFVVYQRAPFHGAGMRYSGVRRQLRRARDAVRQYLREEYGDVPESLYEQISGDDAPFTEEIEDLDI